MSAFGRLEVHVKSYVPRIGILIAVVVALTLGAVALPASGARADIVVSLPQLNIMHQILVDDSAGYVFISQAADGGIVVTDLSGGYVTTLDAGDTAEGMAISGGTLYAALGADHAVAAIDTATISQTTPTQTLYPLSSSFDRPYDLALQDGKLWVSYDQGGGGSGAIGEIDLTAANPTFTPDALTGPVFYSAPDLAADPSNDGFLAAAVPDEDPTPMATYDVATSTAPLATTDPTHFNDCPSSELGIAVTAGGSTVLLICDGYNGALAFDTATLAPAGSYGAPPGSALASAVAVAPDGTVAMDASGGFAPGVTDILTLTTSGAALNTYQYGFYPNAMLNGLAWSADSTTLYVVMVSYVNNNPATATYSLRVIDNANAPVKLSLTGPSQASYGKPVSLSGTVGTVTPPAGSTVTITRTAGDGAASFTTTTNASGAFTFTDTTDPLPGQYAYTASYDNNTSAATHDVTISPVQADVALTLHGFYATSRQGTTTYHLYHHTARIRVIVRVRPSSPGECMRFALQEHYQGKWRARLMTPCIALSVTSEATLSLAASKEALGHPYRIRAAFIPSSDTPVSHADSTWHYLKIEQ